MRLCRLVGSPPYFAANLRSLPARDFYQWVEYCNAPADSNTLARQRAAAGDRDPYNVRFWGVGNESWGCGGEFTPEEYATEYRRFAAWVPRFGVDLAFIGSGPNGRRPRMVAPLLHEAARERRAAAEPVWGWGLHHYSWNTSRGATTDWYQGKGDAISFSNDEWYELLNEADRHGGADHRPLGRDGRARSPAPRQARRRRVGRLVSGRIGGASRAICSDSSRRCATRCLPRSRSTPFIVMPTRWRWRTSRSSSTACTRCSWRTRTRFLATPTFDVFEMYGAHVGGRVGAHGVLGAADSVSARRRHGLDSGGCPVRRRSRTGR